MEVSTDGGATWSDATLQGPVFSKSVTRFRMPWQWNGQRTLLQSRAVDEKGGVQPTRDALFSKLAPQQRYHNHAIQTWSIETDGSVANVYL